MIIPLVGARNLDQLADNLGARDVQLTEEQMLALDEASRIDLGFPHNLLAEPYIRELASGGTWDRIENHRTGRGT